MMDFEAVNKLLSKEGTSRRIEWNRKPSEQERKPEGRLVCVCVGEERMKPYYLTEAVTFDDVMSNKAEWDTSRQFDTLCEWTLLG